MVVNLAERAWTVKYSCPTFTDKPGIRITEGRHPVVEQVLNEPCHNNQPNLYRQPRILTIPRHNMAGKASYMGITA